MSVWPLRVSEQIIPGNERLVKRKHFLIGITRLRNEALILRDTLDYVGRQVDAIIAYDDASTDGSLEILRRHSRVALIVRNEAWEEDIDARRVAEARHRGVLLEIVREQLQFDWTFCFDADERVIGDLRTSLRSLPAGGCDGMRVRLFDAYMTARDQESYQPNRELLGFRRFFGPERRDILMLWHNRPEVSFREGHGREPVGVKRDRFVLPTLRQVAVHRALGADLRLLHSAFSV
jgi:hypothetical protein